MVAGAAAAGGREEKKEQIEDVATPIFHHSLSQQTWGKYRERKNFFSSLSFIVLHHLYSLKAIVPFSFLLEEWTSKRNGKKKKAFILKVDFAVMFTL